ncbi:alpha/beta hydrolase [Phanerochaete sordida]|uniref:Alpha/beta hydrolase n=1 Tax=Phanerochaete sordida TaxID=48140 RepID=A0A9P3GM60_9APHY|nr:alpha/beta hydrolase [Phanerochaete sordida]
MVPLYYSDPSAGEAQIAVMMSPSNYSRDDPNYLGSILFNPGKLIIIPASGVGYLQQFGAYFREIIGPAYDLVGFDPRATGNTTPTLAIWHSSTEALQFYSDFEQNFNSSHEAFGIGFAQEQVFGKLAEERIANVSQAVSTPAVAMDMLSIVRAFGFEKVNYWGVSYVVSPRSAGMVLMYQTGMGRYLARPSQRCSRRTWDASSSTVSQTRMSGTLVRVSTQSLSSTDAALESIYSACLAAGPSLCAIYENSTALIHARVHKLVMSLRTNPIPVVSDAPGVPTLFGVVDYGVIVQQLLETLYNPYTTWPTAADALVQLEQGNATAVWASSMMAMFKGLGGAPPGPFKGPLDAKTAIECGDILGRVNVTFEQAHEQYEAAVNVSARFAPYWYPTGAGMCNGWKMRSRDTFNGSFITNTSTPILMISNTYDPVCPLASARNMSAGFGGSVLLQQNSTGHTSLSGFSTCTANAIHAYFNDGTLPRPGTICQPDTQIFQPSNFSSAAQRDDHGGYTFYEAVRGIAERGYPLGR